MSGLNWQLVTEKLSPDKSMSVEDITDGDVYRIKRIKELGLPETATWKDINDHANKYLI